MWSRENLKARAKYTFKENYWKCVLVSLVLMLVTGGFSVGTGTSSSQSARRSQLDSGGSGYYYDYDYDDDYDAGAALNNTLEGALSFVRTPFGFVTMGAMATFFLLILAAGFALNAFLFNPLEVGCDRFFLINLHEPAEAGNMGFSFDRHYMNIVGTMFCRTIFLLLWSLLFIIPGIIKYYEYMMIPYLLAENPQMSRQQAFDESRRIMDGQKWDAFVLDLSFLGWKILSSLTAGILGVFYVNPYVNSTHAALYEALRFGNPETGL